MTTRGSLRFVRVLVAAILIAGSPAVLAAVGETCDGQTILGNDGWEEIRPPAFTSGPSELSAYAIDVLNPSRLFVSNGVAIQTSLDGGCTFEETYRLEGAGFLPSRITSIAAANGFVYATLDVVTGGTAGPPAVVVSRDAGATWALTASGLIPAGHPLKVTIAPTSPSTAYLVVRAERNALVYRTSDAGQNWTAVSTQLEGLGNPTLGVLSLDPGNPNQLWGGSANGLLTSTDAGASWQPTSISADTAVVNVWKGAEGTPTVAAFGRYDARGFLSEDGGRDWRKLWAPKGTVDSAGYDGNGTLYISLANEAARVYRLGGNRWLPMTSSQLQVRPTFTDLQVASIADAMPHALTPTGVVRLAQILPNPEYEISTQLPPSEQERVNECEGDVKGSVPTPAGSADSLLAPQDRTVMLMPGQTKKITYTLDLAPKPMDVFFLMDTSESSAIGGLGCEIKQGIFDATRNLWGDQNRDTRFGLGETRQYHQYRSAVSYGAGHLNDDVPGRISAEEYYAYKLNLPIGEVDAGFVDTLSSIDFAGASGGNLPALYQMATGEGQDVTPQGPSADDIASGLHARYRPDALPVVFHVVDGWFSTSERTPGYPGQSFEEVIAALRSRGIVHASLFVNNIHSEKADPTAEPDRTHDRPGRSGLEDAQYMARATGSLSPGRVDCDNDLKADLYENSPLVCLYRGPLTVGEGIESLLRDGIKLFRSVRLEPADQRGFVKHVSPEEYDPVDLLVGRQLEFKVTYSCGSDQVGRVEQVGLNALAGGSVVATASALVQCAPMPPPPPPPLVAPALLPPPPPPQILSATGPVQAPAPAAAAQPAPAPANVQAGQPQAVPLPQRQEQPQVALVHAAQGLQDNAAMQYMMVRSNSRPAPLAAARFFLLSGSLALTLAFGIARVRLSRSVVRVRR